MFKLTWEHSSDPFLTTFVLVPDVHALFNTYWMLTGYGRKDGSVPRNIVATDLDGRVVDLKTGLAAVAAQGSYGRYT